jgi:hypothetical protein
MKLHIVILFLGYVSCSTTVPTQEDLALEETSIVCKSKLDDMMRAANWLQIGSKLRRCDKSPVTRDVASFPLLAEGMIGYIKEKNSFPLEVRNAWKVLLSKMEEAPGRIIPSAKDLWEKWIFPPNKMPKASLENDHRGILDFLIFTVLAAREPWKAVDAICRDENVDIPVKKLLQALAWMRVKVRKWEIEFYDFLTRTDKKELLTSDEYLATNKIGEMREDIINMLFDNFYEDPSKIFNFLQSNARQIVHFASLIPNSNSKDEEWKLVKKLIEDITLTIPPEYGKPEIFGKIILYAVSKFEDPIEFPEFLEYMLRLSPESFCLAYNSEEIRDQLALLDSITDIKQFVRDNLHALREIGISCIEQDVESKPAGTEGAFVRSLVGDSSQLKNNLFVDKDQNLGAIIFQEYFNTKSISVDMLAKLTEPKQLAAIYQLIAQYGDKTNFKDKTYREFLDYLHTNKPGLVEPSSRSAAFRKLILVVAYRDCTQSEKDTNVIAKFCANGVCHSLLEDSLRDYYFDKNENSIQDWQKRIFQLGNCIAEKWGCTRNKLYECHQQDIVKPNIATLYTAVERLRLVDQAPVMNAISTWIAEDYLATRNSAKDFSDWFYLQFKAGDASRFREQLKKAPQDFATTKGFLCAMWVALHNDKAEYARFSRKPSDHQTTKLAITRARSGAVPPTLEELCSQGRCELNRLGEKAPEELFRELIDWLLYTAHGENDPDPSKDNLTLIDPGAKARPADRFVYFMAKSCQDDMPNSAEKILCVQNLGTYMQVLMTRTVFTNGAAALENFKALVRWRWTP